MSEEFILWYDKGHRAQILRNPWKTSQPIPPHPSTPLLCLRTWPSTCVPRPGLGRTSPHPRCAGSWPKEQLHTETVWTVCEYVLRSLSAEQG